MELYIIRHAQSANNALYAATGSSEGREADPPLTELGRRQARALASYLTAERPGVLEPYALRQNRGGYYLTHLYTSLMLRAVMTGEAIAEACGLQPVAWPELHERGGLYNVDASGDEIVVQGPGRDYFARSHPTLILPDEMQDDGWWNRPREELDEALARARAVWEKLLSRHGDTEDRVALVTHAGFFQSLLATLIEYRELNTDSVSHIGGIWFTISNASISRIDFDGSFVGVRYLNRLDFMPSELISG